MTIERTRELLGDLVSGLSDAEVAALIAKYLQVADVMLNISLSQVVKNTEKHAIQ